MLIKTAAACTGQFRRQEITMRVLFASLGFLLAACTTPTAAHRPSDTERGQALAEANCSRCHAVGRAGDSPFPEAPPFRTLSQRFRVTDLEESLAEGISVGHPAMPEFAFDPDDAHALVIYLQSIQER
jgi:mono/diheme cytochrome c family protein